MFDLTNKVNEALKFLKPKPVKYIDIVNSLRILSGLGQFLIMGTNKKEVNRTIFEQIYIHKSINPNYACTNMEWIDKLKFHLDCANDKEKTLAKQIRIIEKLLI